MLIFKHIISGLLFVFVIFDVNAQNIIIEGVLKEEGSGEPIMFAHVVIKGVNIGTTTDTSGYFKIKVKNEQIIENILIFSSLGYNSNEFSFPKEGGEFEVYLTSRFIHLNAVEIRPGENPAWEILRKIIENKEKNNPENLENYSCREYSKIRFDLNNFTGKIKQNILFRPFDYIWENTMKNEAGIQYLPVLLVEKSVDHYYRSSPADRKEIFQGKNQTGLAGRNLLKFMEDLAIFPNIYNNYVVVLDKNFPSPINDNYKRNYTFLLTDSSVVSGNKEYNISFKSKHQRELGFDGDMLIDSGSYAIKEVSLRFDIRANVNFVRSYLIKQNFQKVDNRYWMLSNSSVLADFTVLENVSDLTGFYGRNNSKFINYEINKPIDINVFQGPEEIIFQDNYNNRSSSFWDKTRLINYSEEDKQVVKMVEKVENDPAFITRKKIIKSSISGFMPFLGFDIGNFYTFYSHNEIERSRIKFGFRLPTESKLPIKFNSYLAYGTFDEKWKYSTSAYVGGGEGPLKTNKLGFNYKYDLLQLGRSFNQLELDNVISSLTKIGSNSSMIYKKNIEVYYENQIALGLATRLNFFANETYPTAGNVFNIEGSNSSVNKFKTSGVEFTLKYSHLYQDVKGTFYDKSDVSNSFRKYPDIAFKYIYSDQSNFNSDFSYQKLKLSLRQQLRLSKIGFLKYYLEFGKTIGTVPYTHLDIPFGNQQVLLDDYAYNLMGFLEYVADQYISLHVEHHFDGFLLDRIPLVNRLKWRSFLFAKSYFSDLSTQNNQLVYAFPVGVQKLNEPYYEIGFGFENIFKISRIDFIWRLNQNPNRDNYYFIIKPSFKFRF